MKPSRNGPVWKFAAFAAVMVVLTGFLLVVFGQYRTGSTTSYSAVFADSSGLRSGDIVRVAGIRVGTVEGVSLRDDHTVEVDFNADREIVLTTGTTAAVRYLNLVGDRYLELAEGPGSTVVLAGGAEIPVERTSPALDLDLLLGGFKPVIEGLNPQYVNALTSSLLQILQGQEGTVGSLLSQTSSFTSTLADNGAVIEQLIDNLRSVMATLSDSGSEFEATIERLDQLVTQLSQERDPIGAAVDALDRGTASVADLLTQARPPLAGTVDQLNRLAPSIDDDKARLDAALERAPENFRKLVRLGAYGNFIQYYICAISVRVNDASGEVVELPWIQQETGRCSD
ncbi:MCE family protein [Rhodococcus gannanensis]|uniref:MCE family protein n=1 Tax=Rhodococcus gannanensis TaxID=1960308 RepID=A0ABW4NZ28_9NOCA